MFWYILVSMFKESTTIIQLDCGVQQLITEHIMLGERSRHLQPMAYTESTMITHIPYMYKSASLRENMSPVS